MRFLRLAPLFIVLALVAAACSDDGGESAQAGDDTATTTTATPVATTSGVPESSTTTVPIEEPAAPSRYEGYATEIYDDPSVWICWPGADDICAESQDLTLVYGDGSLEVVPFEAVDDAPVDCFYVYPTISSDFTPNSDFEPAASEEIFTARSQAARYGSVCRVFAPLYRQNTIPSLLGQVEAPEGVSTREVAYADVLDAFSHYMATANEGRGVVLLGHSQGAGMISRLLQEEFDGVDGMRERLVTAHILGSRAPTFETIAPCVEVGEVGCIVSYATFRSTSPPPSNSLFGRTETGPALCTNPANLDGSATTMQPEYLFGVGEGGLTGLSPFADPADAEAISTPWIGYPDFIVGECVDDGTFGYLSVEILGDPSDPRTDDIGGDLTPQWGLHLADAQVGLGDLVDLVEAQFAAYVG